MRIDRRFIRDGLTDRQLFFTECWSNFCHKDSIDTDRASYSNALSASQELLFLYGMEDRFHADRKRSRVVGELLDILENDRILRHGAFLGIPDQIIELCPREFLDDRTKSQIERRPLLIKSLCNQLISLIGTHYVTCALDLLEQQIFSPQPLNTPEARGVHDLTNNVMSILLTQGLTLTECYLLYINIFRNTAGGSDAFSQAFNSFRQKLITPLEDVVVRLFITNQKLHELLTNNAPELNFNGCVFRPLPTWRVKHAVSVDIRIRSMSDSSARNGAEQLLRESLDVIAYMAGKGEIAIQKPFEIIRGEHRTEVPRFDNEIEANADRLTAEEFGRFMVAMEGQFSQKSGESRKKISSAFRFFPNGIENASQESRFTSFWSALESLTLGVAPGTPSHDEHVISVVAPCMVLDYVVKQLFALRQVLRFLHKNVPDTVQSEEVNTITLYELYERLKDEDASASLLAEIRGFPYVTFSVNKLIELCRSPEKMETKLASHQDKVTRHIHRLYLLRNTIVHNAGTSPHIQLLTVNLEHYLRGTINAMFYIASIHKSVKTAEEAFTRCQHTAESVCREMNPLRGITEKKPKDKIEKELRDGGLVKKDKLLKAWLRAHD